MANTGENMLKQSYFRPKKKPTANTGQQWHMPTLKKQKFSIDYQSKIRLMKSVE